MSINTYNLRNDIMSLLAQPACKKNGCGFDQIAFTLSIPKRFKATLKQVLTNMLGSGDVVLVKGKYKLKVIPPTPREIKKTAAPEKPISSSLIEGIFDATPLSRNQTYAFVRTDDQDFFVSAEDTLNAYHNDRVAIEAMYGKGRSSYCVVRRILERANKTITGDLKTANGRNILICSNPKIHNWFDVTDPGNAKDGDKVVLEVTNWGNPISSKSPAGRVIECLGASGDPQVELLAVIRQYNLPLTFPDDVIDNAMQLPDTISDAEISRRSDFRDLYTFTIDPASAKDFDDAISLERKGNNWVLYVHIADVAHYVSIGSPLFNEAVQRGNSFYFPKKVIPMLPERLSNQICSLRPQEDKLTMTVITEFDGSGKVIWQKMVESVIRSDVRLNYEEVDMLFDGKAVDLDDKLINVLNEARTLSKVLSAKRIKCGYIFFDLPEIEYEYDSEGFINKLSLAEETESHKLIENFMLVANEYAAMMLKSKAPSTINRIHEDPDTTKLLRLSETLSHYGLSLYERESPNKALQYLLQSMPSPEYHRVFDRLILRSMKKAQYSTKNIRHFGLGMEDYTHFTSPIRRLCDLAIHHLCKTYIIKSAKAKFTPAQTEHYARQSSEREILADEAERDIDRVYGLAFMKEKIGEKYTGLVISTKATGLIVKLNEIPVTAIIKNSQMGPGRWMYKDKEMRFINAKTKVYYQLMDTLKVVVMDVSDDVYLELDNEPDAHRHLFDMNKDTAVKPRKRR